MAQRGHTPQISGVTLVGEDGEPLALSRRQAKRVEMEFNRSLTYGDLAQVLPQLVSPMLGRFAAAARDTDVTQLAVVELLIEKGIITEKELGYKRGEVLVRLGLVADPNAAPEGADDGPVAGSGNEGEQAEEPSLIILPGQ